MAEYKKDIGALGEKYAENLLVKNNYKILEKNFRCKIGEIDIIAQDGKYLVFVEVKTRNTAMYGCPAEAVNYYKQRKIIQVAQFYMAYKKYDGDVRFDVIEILIKLKRGVPVIYSTNLIKNAFTL
ncbi:MAG: YraN family protein [Clostridiaceae bacterium]|nr:YraN family protein [Clostridiaceae bacterium]